MLLLSTDIITIGATLTMSRNYVLLHVGKSICVYRFKGTSWICLKKHM